ncbi:MAG TPA: hypothetical protein VJA66_11340 [Thermoanaerobaculia bacterium]
MRKETAESRVEARWPALIAVVTLGGLYLALPPNLLVGPRWLYPVVVAGLVIPILALHRMGRHDLDRRLGYILSGVLTLMLLLSLILLITALPSRKEDPLSLLQSAAALWVTNVIVFALWYWRLDAGGPHQRESRKGHTHGAFFFPQMMQGAPPSPEPGPWAPRFVDYLFVAFNTSTAFSPTDTPVLTPWAKVLSMLQASISLAVVAILAARAVGML